LTIRIEQAALEKACKEIIETILFCLPNAYKGTVYRVGNPPDLVTMRVTSGILDRRAKSMSWGLPERSDYNPPGKPWIDYRDELGRPLEAMAWCVERQRSWTAEDAVNDARSVRLQVEGIWEDFHHMEPVLIRKRDLYVGDESEPIYPRNYNGEILWHDSDYVVIAVIKIHFRPHTVKLGSPETLLIKRLSRALGTELLSYQLKQQSLEAIRRLAEDRLKTCNILADSLRNAITKSGLIFSLIKLELSSLREQWEGLLLKDSEKRVTKRRAVEALNNILEETGCTAEELGQDLQGLHNRFLELFLPPERGENWIRMQLEDKWDQLLHKRPLGDEHTKVIRQAIAELKESLYLGQDPAILAAYSKASEGMIKEWTDLIYQNTDRVDFQFLDRLIRMLDDPSLNLPYQEKSRKTLIRLKALAEIMGQLEDSTNTVLREVLNGSDNGSGLNNACGDE